jgi:hypothetical protein
MTAPVKQLSDGNPGGSGLGQSSTDKISFYGVTPIAQRSGASQGTFTSTTTQSTGWGFLSSTAADAAIALILEMRLVLVNSGLMAGA